MKRLAVGLVLLAVILISGKFLIWPEFQYQYHVNTLNMEPVGKYEVDRFNQDLEQLRLRRDRVVYQLEQTRNELSIRGRYVSDQSLQTLYKRISDLEIEEVQLTTEYFTRVKQAPYDAQVTGGVM